MLHYLFTQIPGILIGAILMAFMPAVGRKLKALFVKEAQVIRQKI